MITSHKPIPLSDNNWKRINMRSVSHVLGAEMMHNLYNRHWPRINSLRFRHTITNYKNGVVESYAPVSEWNTLQKWLSKKFIACDTILIREIEAILNPDYAFVNELLSKIDKTDLSQTSNDDLALLLIDVMDYSLGDIYKLNVVQIEYSLNYALHQLLADYEPVLEDRNLLLSQLVSPGELTVAQEEEIEFGIILNEGLTNKVFEDIEHSEILPLIKAHHKRYAPTHCAYGEESPRIKDYIDKYLYQINNSVVPLSYDEAMRQVKDQQLKSQALLGRLNNESVTLLCNLMANIGVFRDKNKAKLGETVTRRLSILDEIVRRTNVQRVDLNMYLLYEIVELLDKGTNLDKKIIATRKADGFSFVRNEDVIPYSHIAITNSTDDAFINGICASPGYIEGTAKIVISKDDIGKVEPNDIMVAIGTDFDLLEIMNLCSAIITEEGGLLSHASVVSREMLKPCLIGVENATKIFKDDDMLRLDATNGRIYIIK